MKKKLSYILLAAMLTMLLIPFASVSAYTDGLLNARILNVGNQYGSSSVTTGLATDGSLTTYYNVNVGSSTRDSLWYTFGDPVPVDAYYLDLKSTNALAQTVLKFYNGTTLIHSIVNPVRTGVKTTIPILNAVTGISFETTNASYQAQVYEIDVFGTLPDTTPPPVPTGLSGTASNGSTALSWNGVTDTGLQGYNVYADNVKVTASPITGTSYTASVTNNVSHTFQITSIDVSGNESARSDPITSHFDTISPVAPIGLVSSPSANGSTLLTWTANTDDTVGYNVFQDGVKKNGSLITINEYLVTGLLDNQTYSFTVTAQDAAGNESGKSSAVTYYIDSSAPDAPTSLSGTAGFYSVDLSWTDSTAADLAGFNVYKSGVKLNTSLIVGTSYTATELNPDTQYIFTVRSMDNTGNESENSNTMTIKTKVITVTPPVSVKAKQTESGVDLTWSQPEVIPDKYIIYRDGVQIAETTTLDYADADVEKSKTYKYEVSSYFENQESAKSTVTIYITEHPVGFEEADAGFSVIDLLTTTSGIIMLFAGFIILVLAILVAPQLKDFMFLIISQLKQKKDNRQSDRSYTARRSKREETTYVVKAKDDKQRRQIQKQLNMVYKTPKSNSKILKQPKTIQTIGKRKRGGY